MLHQRLKVNMELRNATTWNSELQLFKRRSITFQNPMKSNPIVHCSTVKCVEHVSNKSHWKIQKTDNKNPIKNPIPNHGKKHEQIQWTSWWDNKNTHQLTNPKKNGGKQKKNNWPKYGIPNQWTQPCYHPRAPSSEKVTAQLRCPPEWCPMA